METAKHSGCPFKVDLIGAAVQKCPFLGQLARDHGQGFARDAAQSIGKTRGPIFEESVADYHATFRVFHGSKGVVPLTVKKQCPFSHGKAERSTHVEGPSAAVDCQSSLSGAAPVSQCPYHISHPSQSPSSSVAHAAPAPAFASLSFSAFKFLPGPDEFIRRRRRRKQERRQQDLERAKQRSSSSQNKARSQANRQSGLHKWRTHPIVGGLIPLNAAGKYVCPPLVVAGRAAVAQLKITKALRPRKLPVKLLGVGGHCLLANIPCGMMREHTEKFSPAWFLAVHLTVPYFGFLRKGVGMPKWAILMTVATAIAGQAIGVRLERKRLSWLQQPQESAQPVAPEQSQMKLDTLQSSRADLSLPGKLDRESKCPLIKTCKELEQCSRSSSTMPANNFVLSN